MKKFIFLAIFINLAFGEIKSVEHYSTNKDEANKVKKDCLENTITKDEDKINCFNAIKGLDINRKNGSLYDNIHNVLFFAGSDYDKDKKLEEDTLHFFFSKSANCVNLRVIQPNFVEFTPLSNPSKECQEKLNYPGVKEFLNKKLDVSKRYSRR